MTIPEVKLLTLDPWNMNRYAFADGNPISFVELDGHRYIVADGVYAHSITGKIVELINKWHGHNRIVGLQENFGKTPLSS